MRGLPTVAVTLALVTPVPGFAAEHWVDPSAPMGGDGSREAPFDTIDAVLEGAGAGDTVWLETGDYGELSISGLVPEERLTLAAADAAEPRFSRVQLQDSANVTLRGLHVAGEAAGTLMELDGEELVVEACVLMSAPDTTDWSAQDWIDRASTGIEVSGTVNTVRDNYLLNVGYGISVSATHSLIEGNVIENFSRDGLRGLGDYTVFQYNTVKNCYAVDDHHDDGFQSWSEGDEGVGTGEVTGIVLRGNTIINYEDPNQPYRGTLQGIGCFDGTFVDWVIENNVVMTDHWHGITLLGARNCTVVNNTVIDLNDESPGPPWISVDDHKDGTQPVDCVVRNNLTTDLANSSAVIEEGNIVLSMTELADYFVDAAAHDLHLLEAAPAVDAGLAASPALDRDRIPRPQGAGIDVGAYEWHEPGVGAEGGNGGAASSNASMASSATSGAGAPGQGGAQGQGGASGQGGTAAPTSSAESGPDSSATGSSTASGGSGGTTPDAGHNSDSSGSDSGAGGCGCRMLLPARLPASASALFLIVVSGLAWRRRGRGAFAKRRSSTTRTPNQPSESALEPAD
ncbi:MAG TPA: right-handed parallel beta-helix repeat-containing protein [Polyangiaceae bacterium]|nr:right-handed parallel beta-helix repeat-containing protein [Polyangiaceae bacterium]